MIRILNRYLLLALPICAFSFLVSAVAATGGKGRETIVILVRHAEKAVDGTDDPPLSDAGRKRAAALSHAVAAAGIKAVFATEFRRTQQTVEPTSLSQKLPVTRVEAAKTDQLARQILDTHRGETVLVAGHSNTIPEIIAALGAPKIEPLDESRYDDLYVVFIPPDGPARLLNLKYGQTE